MKTYNITKIMKTYHMTQADRVIYFWCPLSMNIQLQVIEKYNDIFDKFLRDGKTRLPVELRELIGLDKTLQDHCYSGYLWTVMECLRAGANPNSGGGVSLVWASGKGYINIVKLLIKHGVYINSFDDKSLVVAAENGHLSVVKLLIKRGVPANAHNSQALVRASENGQFKVVKYLLSKGADPTNTNALNLASVNGHKSVVRILKSAMKKFEHSQLIV